MDLSVRIGIDATTWWNDRGFGRFTRELVRALCARSGAFQYVLVVDREMDPSLPAEAGVLRVPLGRPVTDSAVGSGSRSLRDMARFSRSISQARFDLFFFPAVYSYVPLISRTPCVVAFHDTTAERYPELLFPTRRNQLFWNAKVRVARAQARRVMTVSSASARDVERILGVRSERIDVVSEAASSCFRRLTDRARIKEARSRYGVSGEGALLLHVGGLNPHKNLLGLLRCLPQVLDAHPHTQLALVGDVSGRGFFDNVADLKRFVASNPRLDAQVIFTGYLPDEDLAALMSGATALVLPSLWEGFGLPAVEAMACGLPVIASDRGSLPEVVGDAGVFFDPESDVEMAAAICRALADTQLRERMQRRALERAALFSWERSAMMAEASFRRALRLPEAA